MISKNYTAFSAFPIDLGDVLGTRAQTSGSTASSPKFPRFNKPFLYIKIQHDSDAWGNKAKQEK